MIYISYGVPKSASTFTYVVTENVLRAAGYAPVMAPGLAKGNKTRVNYVDPVTWGAIQKLRNDIGEATAVIKTHGAPDPELLAAIDRSEVFASLVVRDPREIALSLLDHGARVRRQGGRDFTEFHTLPDTFRALDEQLQRMRIWLKSSKVLILTYDDICFNTSFAVQKIIDQIGASVSVEQVLSTLPNKTEVEQFNKGVSSRYDSEMPPHMQQTFLQRYADMYRLLKPPKAVPLEVSTDMTPSSVGSGRLATPRQAEPIAAVEPSNTGIPSLGRPYLYDLLFWPYETRPINILGLGLPTGETDAPCLQAWLSYFQNGRIYGFDSADLSQLKHPRFTFVRGDAGVESDLRRLADTAPKFDIVIDDTRTPLHQQLALKTLFPKLAPGGIYVIETIRLPQSAGESGSPEVPDTATLLQGFLESDEYSESAVLPLDFMRDLRSAISGFASLGASEGPSNATRLIVLRRASDTNIEQRPSGSGGAVKNAADQSVQQVWTDDLIRVAYKTVLNRQPDPPGLQAYRGAFKDVPVSVGLERTLASLLRSKEFRNRQVFEEKKTPG